MTNVSKTQISLKVLIAGSFFWHLCSLSGKPFFCPGSDKGDNSKSVQITIEKKILHI